MNPCKITSGIHYADILALFVVHGVLPFFKDTTAESIQNNFAKCFEIILSKTRNKAVSIKITTAIVARVSIPFKDR